MNAYSDSREHHQLSVELGGESGMSKPAEGKHPEDGPELEAGAGAEECAEGLGLEVEAGASVLAGEAAEDMAEEAVVGAASTPAAEAAGEA